MEMKKFKPKKESLLILLIIFLLILLYTAIYIGHNSEKICNKIIAKNYEQIISYPCIKQCLNIEDPYKINYNYTGGDMKWNTQQK